VIPYEHCRDCERCYKNSPLQFPICNITYHFSPFSLEDLRPWLQQLNYACDSFHSKVSWVSLYPLSFASFNIDILVMFIARFCF
jgi:hypothetical protein